MNIKFTLGLALFVFSTHASAFIENSSEIVRIENEKTLIRVVSLESEKGGCTGTWIKKGIILTAGHCASLAESPLFKVNKIAVTAIMVGHVEKEKPKGNVNPFSALLDVLSPSEEVPDTRSDFAVIAIDPAPLKELKLPSKMIEFVDVDNQAFAPQTQFLVSGYGIQKFGNGDDDFGVKRAALIENIQSEDPSIILSSARRDFGFSLSAEAGQSMKDLEMKTQFENAAGVEKSGSMVLMGDSGGPAFIKDRSGSWILAGVASNIELHPDANQQMAVVVLNGGEEFVSYVELNQKLDSKVPLQAVIPNVVKGINDASFKIDFSKPFEKSWKFGLLAKGEVYSRHTSLKDAGVRDVISQMVKEAEARLKKLK